MPYTYILIIIILFLYYKRNKKKECLDLENPQLLQYYKKAGITIDKTNKNLIKDGKIAPYIFKFNTSKGKHMVNDKYITKKMLQTHNIPQPHFYYWNKDIPNGVNWYNIRHVLKLPLVIKPTKGTHGNNVYVNIKSINKAKQIINKLLANNHEILIEEMEIGYTHRILILNGEIISIIKRHPPRVIGNGINTLAYLIDKQQKNNKYKVKKIGWEKGKLQGYKKSDIIPSGVNIELTKTINLHNGATNEVIDINSVHVDNLHMFKNLNKIFKLKLSGIDYISRDLGISHKDEYGGGVIELNWNPGIETNLNIDPNSVEKLINNIQFN